MRCTLVHPCSAGTTTQAHTAYLGFRVTRCTLVHLRGAARPCRRTRLKLLQYWDSCPGAPPALHPGAPHSTGAARRHAWLVVVMCHRFYTECSLFSLIARSAVYEAPKRLASPSCFAHSCFFLNICVQ